MPTTRSVLTGERWSRLWTGTAGAPAGANRVGTAEQMILGCRLAMRAKAAMMPAMVTVTPALKIFTTWARGPRRSRSKTANEIRGAVGGEGVIAQRIERHIDVDRPVME
jgi:hypothetical protein